MRIKDAKRLVLDLYPEEHAQIKKTAYDQGMTMKKWVLLAVAAKIKEEMKLGYKRLL